MAQLKSNKVILLTGARRVGKTVLMTQLADAFDGLTLLLNVDGLDLEPVANAQVLEFLRHPDRAEQQ